MNKPWPVIESYLQKKESEGTLSLHETLAPRDAEAHLDLAPCLFEGGAERISVGPGGSVTATRTLMMWQHGENLVAYLPYFDKALRIEIAAKPAAQKAIRKALDSYLRA